MRLRPICLLLVGNQLSGQMSKILYVGDNSETFASAVKQKHSDAVLLDHNTYKYFFENTNVVGYTSLMDLPKIAQNKTVLFDLCLHADEVHYKPISDTDSMYMTEFTLYKANQLKKHTHGLIVHNNRYLKLWDYPVNSTNLWLAGCSITNGVGVKKSETFGELLAQDLCLPKVDLSRPGSSIEFAADQILRSKIQKNDIVVWGLTHESRYTVWEGDNSVQGLDSRQLVDETRLYKAVIAVHQVINFCNAISAKLLLLPVICSEKLHLHICNTDEYVSIPYRYGFLDLGNDNLHPGPLQHKEYFTCLDRAIQNLDV